MSLMSKKQISRELGISLRGVDRLISSGQLAVVRVGRLVRVKSAELNAFIKRNSYGGLTA